MGGSVVTFYDVVVDDLSAGGLEDLIEWLPELAAAVAACDYHGVRCTPAEAAEVRAHVVDEIRTDHLPEAGSRDGLRLLDALAAVGWHELEGMRIEVASAPDRAPITSPPSTYSSRGDAAAFARVDALVAAGHRDEARALCEQYIERYADEERSCTMAGEHGEATRAEHKKSDWLARVARI